MNYLDLILFFPALLVVGAYAKRKQKNIHPAITNTKIFLPALWVKVFGATCAGMIYFFYYAGGDTVEYFRGVTVLREALFENPVVAFKLLFTKAGNYNFENFKYTSQFYMFRDGNSFLIIKLTFLISLFTFGSYLTTSFFVALLCFKTSWSLFEALVRKYPTLDKEIGYSMFFIPSVFFWGSGIFKDTFMYIGMCVCITSFMKIFYFKEQKFKRLILFVIAIVIMYKIRSFFVVVLLPSFVIWYLVSIKERFNSQYIRALMGPVLIALSFGLISIALGQLSSINEEFTEEAIKVKLNGFHSYHGKLADEGASGYSIGHVDYTPAGLMKKIPICVFITLFRPFVWETRNPVMLLSAIESTFFLFFTIWVILKVGVFSFISRFLNRTDAMFCLLFTIFFGFLTGLTALNFGALSRYKIPILPLYLIGLFIILQKVIITVKKEDSIK